MGWRGGLQVLMETADPVHAPPVQRPSQHPLCTRGGQEQPQTPSAQQKARSPHPSMTTVAASPDHGAQSKGKKLRTGGFGVTFDFSMCSRAVFLNPLFPGRSSGRPCKNMCIASKRLIKAAFGRGGGTEQQEFFNSSRGSITQKPERQTYL